VTGAHPASRREESAGWVRSGQRFLAPLLLRRFPAEVPFGFVGRIAPAHGDVDLAIDARRLSDREAIALVEGARSVTEAELTAGAGATDRTELEVERDEASDLGRAVAARTQELWKVGIRWVVRGASAAAAEGGRLRLAERLAALGFSTRVPRYEVATTLAAHLRLPASDLPAGYAQTLTTDGLAALFPFPDESVLEPGGILVGLALADACPVVLDRWSHASHSWGIFGTTGSGKSFAAALFALRSRWLRPDLQIVVLDPLGEYRRFVEAIGGEVVRLADGAAATLNPLDPATTGGDRREKAGRVAAIVRALFPSVSDEESALLDTTVTGLYAAEELPTFARLVDRLAAAGPRAERLARLLDVFRSGSLRFVDGPTTLDPSGSVVGFDFSGIPDEQLAFHLAYVLDWTYGRLRSRPGPKLVIVDEAHLLARQEATSEFFDRLVRHMRHFSAGVMVLTQSPDDLLARASGRSLARNLYATAFLRLAEVSGATRSFFGLGNAEAEWLPRARLPRESGYSESLWRIGEWHLPLAIVASTPELEFLARLFPRPGAGPTEDPDAGGTPGL
jgi:hypothetical protein